MRPMSVLMVNMLLKFGDIEYGFMIPGRRNSATLRALLQRKYLVFDHWSSANGSAYRITPEGRAVLDQIKE